MPKVAINAKNPPHTTDQARSPPSGKSSRADGAPGASTDDGRVLSSSFFFSEPFSMLAADDSEDMEDAAT